MLNVSKKKTEGNSWEYISSKAKAAIEKMSTTIKKTAQFAKEDLENLPLLIASTFEDLNEMEFDWIKQFWNLGLKHSEINMFWTEKITQLEQLWLKLESDVNSLNHSVFF